MNEIALLASSPKRRSISASETSLYPVACEYTRSSTFGAPFQATLFQFDPIFLLKEFRVVRHIRRFINLNYQATFAKIFFGICAAHFCGRRLRFLPSSIRFFSISDNFCTESFFDFGDCHIVAAVGVANQSFVD